MFCFVDVQECLQGKFIKDVRFGGRQVSRQKSDLGSRHSIENIGHGQLGMSKMAHNCRTSFMNVPLGLQQQQCKGQQACLLFLAIFLCCSTFQSQLKTTKAFCFRLCIDMLKQYHTGLVSHRGGVDSTKENLIYCRQESRYQMSNLSCYFLQSHQKISKLEFDNL